MKLKLTIWVLLLALMGCKGDSDSPAAPANAASVVFNGWYQTQTFNDSSGHQWTRYYGYVKNVGTDTAYNVKAVYRSSANPSGTPQSIQPPTLAPESLGTFNIAIPQGGTVFIPEFTWTAGP